MNLTGEPRDMTTQVEFSQWLATLDNNTVAKLGMCILGVSENMHSIDNYFNRFMTMYNENHNTSINVLDGSLIVLSEMSRRWLESVVITEESQTTKE